MWMNRLLCLKVNICHIVDTELEYLRNYVVGHEGMVGEPSVSELVGKIMRYEKKEELVVYDFGDDAKESV